MGFTLSSPAFADGADVPVLFTCDGEDRSPRLTWTDPPDRTRSFVLIMDDPDAPRGTFTHWVLYDIPADTAELGENVPNGAIGRSGRNSFGRTGYGGPCPPPGDQPHRYRFTLHALDIASLDLPANATRDKIETRMSAHVLGTAQLVGRYQRKSVAAGRR